MLLFFPHSQIMAEILFILCVLDFPLLTLSRLHCSTNYIDSKNGSQSGQEVLIVQICHFLQCLLSRSLSLSLSLHQLNHFKQGCMHAYSQECTHAHTRTHIHTHTDTHTQTRTHTHTDTHTHTQTHIYKAVGKGVLGSKFQVKVK